MSLEGTCVKPEPLRAVLLDPVTPEQFAAFQNELSDPRTSVEVAPPSQPRRDELLARADALVVWATSIDVALLNQAPRLRLIVRPASSKAPVDTAAVQRRGIVLQSVPSPALISVAEHAMLLMLALTKELLPAHRGVQAGAYPPAMRPKRTTQTEMAYNWLDLKRFDAVYGRTLGIIGFGVIGRALAERARAFQMNVLYTKPQRLDPALEEASGVSYAALDDLLRRSDVVSLHVKVTPETERFIGTREFALMKPTAYFINTSRGALVDEAAMTEALLSRRIAGAGLDVFEEEPLPRTSPLATLDNVILTPHSAGIPLDRSRTWEVVEAARVIRTFEQDAFLGS